jgi:hypothetical protein
MVGIADSIASKGQVANSGASLDDNQPQQIAFLDEIFDGLRTQFQRLNHNSAIVNRTDDAIESLSISDPLDETYSSNAKQVVENLLRNGSTSDRELMEDTLRLRWTSAVATPEDKRAIEEITRHWPNQIQGINTYNQVR